MIRPAPTRPHGVALPCRPRERNRDPDRDRSRTGTRRGACSTWNMDHCPWRVTADRPANDPLLAVLERARALGFLGARPGGRPHRPRPRLQRAGPPTGHGPGPGKRWWHTRAGRRARPSWHRPRAARRDGATRRVPPLGGRDPRAGRSGAGGDRSGRNSGPPARAPPRVRRGAQPILRVAGSDCGVRCRLPSSAGPIDSRGSPRGQRTTTRRRASLVRGVADHPRAAGRGTQRRRWCASPRPPCGGPV